MSAASALFICYHFAPESASGTHRGLHFFRHLSSAGVSVQVITRQLESETLVDSSLLRLVPDPSCVTRVAPGRPLGDAVASVRLPRLTPRRGQSTAVREAVGGGSSASAVGRRLSSLSPRSHLALQSVFPDPQRGWYVPARRVALEIAARCHPAFVFSTGPPWTALRVAHYVARARGCPLVLDFRDPWFPEMGRGSDYRHGWARHTARRWLASMIREAELVIFNSPAIERMTAAAFDDLKRPSFHTILNGTALPRRRTAGPFPKDEPIRLRHLGNLYLGRSMIPVVRAVKRLVLAGHLRENEILIEQVGPVSAAERAELECPLANISGSVPFQEAARLISAPAILVLPQPPNLRCQIPTKLYDYLASGNPILALTNADGATWQVARGFERCLRADPDDVAAICDHLRRLTDRWRKGLLEQAATEEDTAHLTKVAAGRRFVELVTPLLR